LDYGLVKRFIKDNCREWGQSHQWSSPFK
jgi:hypothetical protein